MVRKTVETTKMTIVYDVSARAIPDSPSLNDCLNSGPALQNRLCDILTQQRGYPVVLTGDIKKGVSTNTDSRKRERCTSVPLETKSLARGRNLPIYTRIVWTCRFPILVRRRARMPFRRVAQEVTPRN